MARTTLDIDTPVLKDLKRLQREQKKSLGRLVSDLLMQALAAQRRARRPAPAFSWHSQDMTARVDISDRDTLYDVMDPKRERK
ncbi:MAG TPA: antitoxin [Candidatus Binatia bacterium]|nr:antitoxin [Candidatus Binatia bacterium]